MPTGRAMPTGDARLVLLANERNEPARIDLGYQLNPIDGLLINGEPQKRRFRMHFSIGQAF